MAKHIDEMRSHIILPVTNIKKAVRPRNIGKNGNATHDDHTQP